MNVINKRTPHTYRDGRKSQHWQQMLIRMQRSRNSQLLLLGMQNHTATSENGWKRTSKPKPVYECLCAVLCSVTQSCPTLCNSMNCSLPDSSVPGDSPGKSGLPCPPPGDLPNSGMEPKSPTLQADSLPNEPPGKPKNTTVGSQSLLQEIFPTQESNQGFPHCRRIPYQLSY